MELTCYPITSKPSFLVMMLGPDVEAAAISCHKYLKIQEATLNFRFEKKSFLGHWIVNSECLNEHNLKKVLLGGGEMLPPTASERMHGNYKK